MGLDVNTLNFSSCFGVDRAMIEDYGALDISLVNDLPLFIDPFLLFASTKPEYQQIHREIVRYLLFLKDWSLEGQRLDRGMFKAWFSFSEVKQNWLGFSKTGNKGRGMGFDFAEGLYDGFKTIFADFGEEAFLESPHMEKFCLIRPQIGKDKISDFTANFAKRYLLEYTERFALENLRGESVRQFNVGRVSFDYETGCWVPGSYTLPVFRGEYVLLTPRDMLTREDTFLNRSDMIDRFASIAPSVGDQALRFQLDWFIREVLSRKENQKRRERNAAIGGFIDAHPQFVNYYLKYKEACKADARSNSAVEVESQAELFIDAASQFTDRLSGTSFYSKFPTSYSEALDRVHYLKQYIENEDGYKLLWTRDGRGAKESDVQLLFKLVWYGTARDVNREPNNGRGPVDYAVSLGAGDKALVEFKLARNPKLKQNLANQVDIYKRANKTRAAITCIICYTDNDREKVECVLNELGIAGSENVVVIDARKDKPSASNAK